MNANTRQIFITTENILVQKRLSIDFDFLSSRLLRYMIYLCPFIHMAIELEIVNEISFQGKASLRLIEIASHGKFISALVLLSGISKAYIHVNTFTVEI